MGGVIKSLFGGSSQNSNSTSNSGNSAFDYLKGALGGNVNTGNNAMSQIAGLLGVGGDPAAGKAGLDNYLGSTGYNFMMDQGQHAITGSAAAKGLLGSGSTAKALVNFGQGQAGQYFNNYLTQLQQLVGGGQQSANTIAGAGQFSNSQATSKGSSQQGIIPGLTGFFKG